jgi:hypothetical protein
MNSASASASSQASKTISGGAGRTRWTMAASLCRSGIYLLDRWRSSRLASLSARAGQNAVCSAIHTSAEGDLVVFHDTAQATSTGDFLRVRDGRIVEHWNNFDQLGILRQLGAIPEPAAT